MIVLATNPWFWIAATSLGDFVWALGLLLAGAVAARRDHRVLAGVLFALAVGCRLSTVFLVLAWLVAEQLGDRPAAGAGAEHDRSPARSRWSLGALCFVPSWLSADRTLDFLETTSELRGPAGSPRPVGHQERGVLRRAGRRSCCAFGLPRLRRAWPSWHTSTAFRFAVLAFVATEVLYLRFPFKPLHLIPAAMAVALVIGHFGTEARRWIGVLIAAQLIGGLVTTTLGRPRRRGPRQQRRDPARPHRRPAPHRRPMPPRRP